jgi:hypothetical protein
MDQNEDWPARGCGSRVCEPQFISKPPFVVTFSPKASVHVSPILKPKDENRNILGIAQAVSHRPLTSKARFDPSAVHVGFMVIKVALTQGFLRVLLSPCQPHSTVAPYA